jgi:signal transduction histidine kinase
VQSFDAPAMEKGVTLTCRRTDGLRVLGDSTKLTHIIQHLVGNAVKFTPPGGHVWISLDRDGAWAQLRVTDDGAGIAAEDLPMVFEPFYQTQTNAKRAGLGVGLALVAELAALHGGTVSAHSAGLGKGSEFTVKIPTTRAAATQLS